MRIGFGLYKHMLSHDNLCFAKQCGATDIVVHMCDYFYNLDTMSKDDQPVGTESWGYAKGEVWSADELIQVRDLLSKYDLNFYAVENFDPKIWNHILFGEEGKEEQIELVKEQITNVAKAGIPVFGYNFSLTGVSGRCSFNDIRGNASTVGMNGIPDSVKLPLPNKLAWNMIVDPDKEGFHSPITEEQLWNNFSYFLKEVVPHAQKVGVKLAAHPDDPPIEQARGLPKLVYKQSLYDRLLQIIDSPSNCIELCLGTISEMSDGDAYLATNKYVGLGKVPYIHLRNVKGKVPYYKETFIDEGDINVPQIMELLKSLDFDGVVIPDHSPQMSCSAPWHAGMAYAMGYINALAKGA